MRLNKITVAIGLVLINTSLYAQEVAEKQDSAIFSPLQVSAQKVNHQQEALEEPGAVSSRDVNKNLQSIDSTIRSMPGVYTQIDPAQGAVNVNIRGMSGFGRVNTMVDGVTQTFYGTSTSGTSVIHGSTSNMTGVLIDKNFIVGIDVIRGESNGVQGINALAGSANMRTIGVDDVVFHGKSFGVRSRFSVGSNGIGRSGMLAVGKKIKAFGGAGSVGVMAALSGSSIYSNFNNGDGINSEEFGYDQFMRQNPKSQLYKVDIKPDEFNNIEMSARAYQNRFSRRDISSNDYYIKYHHTSFSELIDLNVIASTSAANQKYQNDSLYSFYNTSAQNRSDALSINNDSRFSIGKNDFTFSIGGKLMKTRYDKLIKSGASDPDNPDAAAQAIENNPFAPSGKQDIAALYSGIEMTHGIYQLGFNLNYTRSRIGGFKPACDESVICIPQGARNIDKSEASFDPSVQLSAQVTPWLQPFINYSKSKRAPNIQEMFFSNSGGASMNPFLKPEKAETWQAGFNLERKGLLVKDDTFNLKALAFHSNIKNYIFSETFLVCNGGRKCRLSEANANDWEDVVEYTDNMNIYINSLTPIKMRGFELEMSYDTGAFFGTMSYSKQYTDQPTSIASYAFGSGDITELPKDYLTLDTGVRFFNQRLIVGSVIKYTGKAYRLSPYGDQDEVTGELLKEELPKIPTIVDLYLTYEMNRNFKLKFGVQNVENKNYSEALNKLNTLQQSDDTAANTARGRTYFFSAEMRF